MLHWTSEEIREVLSLDLRHETCEKLMTTLTKTEVSEMKKQQAREKKLIYCREYASEHRDKNNANNTDRMMTKYKNDPEFRKKY